MSRDANPEYPIHVLLAARHSPYAFDPARPVDAATVKSLLEAARWTMSSYNAQPWRYIVGVRDDGSDTGARKGTFPMPMRSATRNRERGWRRANSCCRASALLLRRAWHCAQLRPQLSRYCAYTPNGGI